MPNLFVLLLLRLLPQNPARKASYHLDLVHLISERADLGGYNFCNAKGGKEVVNIAVTLRLATENGEEASQ